MKIQKKNWGGEGVGGWGLGRGGGAGVGLGVRMDVNKELFFCVKIKKKMGGGRRSRGVKLWGVGLVGSVG